MVSEPLPLPVEGVAVSHSSLTETDQPVFEMTFTTLELPSVASKVIADVESKRVSLPEAWVTVIVLEAVPLGEIVMVAVRFNIAGFS